MLIFLFGLVVGACLGLIIAALLGGVPKEPEFDGWGPPEDKP
jgi:hypothetical protein